MNYYNSQNRGSNPKNQEAPKFGSAYNFVPLNGDVLIPWWNGDVTHDAPLLDAESGKITLTLTNRTPMFVRDGENEKSNKGTDKETPSVYSAHINTKDGKLYFIPGSSIRGMIRSVTEILSFSRLSDGSYDDDYFGMRTFPKKGQANSKYTIELEKVQCGWLRMAKETLYLTPCGEPKIYEVHNDPKLSQVLDGKSKLDAKKKFSLLEKRFGTSYPKIDGGRLVCTGDINGKKHEYLFGPDSGPEIELPEILKKKFLTVYKPSIYYDYIYKSLRKGERIAVFYATDEENRIKHLGLTRFYRIPYKYSVKSCINQTAVNDCGCCEYDDNDNEIDIPGHDMAETLFGYVDDNKGEALKGRVWIDSAFTSRVIHDNELQDNMGVLGEPHASFFSRYLVQDDNVSKPFITYDGAKKEAPNIAGRKRYRSHADAYITNLPQGNGNIKVMTKFKPLPKGLQFKFTISFHNLMPEEIGLLLSAITLHGTKGAHHNIGLAKAYGYGKLDVKIDQLIGLEHDAEYYLKFFEYYINNFTLLAYTTECPWRDTKEIKTLMAIMSDHDNGLEPMELKDFRKAQQNEFKAQVKLRETPIPVNSYISDVEQIDLAGAKLHNALKKLASK